METKQELRGFVKQLEKRTLEFAIRIIRLSSMLPNTAHGKVAKTQLTKWVPWERLEPDYKECGELLAIFTSIGKNK